MKKHYKQTIMQIWLYIRILKRHLKKWKEYCILFYKKRKVLLCHETSFSTYHSHKSFWDDKNLNKNY